MPLAHRAAVTTELIFSLRPPGGCVRAYVCTYVRACACVRAAPVAGIPVARARRTAPLARSEDAEDGGSPPLLPALLLPPPPPTHPRRRDAAPRLFLVRCVHSIPLPPATPPRGVIAGPIDTRAYPGRRREGSGPRCHPAFFPSSPRRGIAARSCGDNSPGRGVEGGVGGRKRVGPSGSPSGDLGPRARKLRTSLSRHPRWGTFPRDYSRRCVNLLFFSLFASLLRRFSDRVN